MKVSPYLHFDGRCEEAFGTYAALLGGEIAALMRWSDMPRDGASEDAREDCRRSPDIAQKVMHADLQLGMFSILGADQPGPEHPAPAGFGVTLQVDSNAEAERIYDGLSEGGSVRMPLGPTFFSQAFAMLTDRFGIPWLIVSAER